MVARGDSPQALLAQKGDQARRESTGGAAVGQAGRRSSAVQTIDRVVSATAVVVAAGLSATAAAAPSVAEVTAEDRGVRQDCGGSGHDADAQGDCRSCHPRKAGAPFASVAGSRLMPDATPSLRRRPGTSASDR